MCELETIAVVRMDEEYLSVRVAHHECQSLRRIFEIEREVGSP